MVDEVVFEKLLVLVAVESLKLVQFEVLQPIDHLIDVWFVDCVTLAFFWSFLSELGRVSVERIMDLLDGGEKVALLRPVCD